MRRATPLLLALGLLAGVALAGCMDRAPKPPGENASDGETALEESSTREQFQAETDGGEGAGGGGLASDVTKLAPGTVLGTVVGLLLWAAGRPR